MRLDHLCNAVGGFETGAPDHEVTALAIPAAAGPGKLSLAMDRASACRLLEAESAVIVPALLADLPADAPWLTATHPKAAWARAAAVLSAALPRPVALAAPAFLGEGASYGEGCCFGPGVVLGEGTRVGAFCRLGSGVTLGPNVQLGNRVVIGPNSCLGHAPFDLAEDGGAWLPLPGLAGVLCGDDVRIGALCTLPAGCSRPTTLESNVVLDDHVHVGHDAHLGTGTAVAAAASLAGYVRLGRACKIGGRVAIAEGVNIADRVTVLAMAGVGSDITTAGARYAGAWPAQPARQWWRLVARIRR